MCQAGGSLPPWITLSSRFKLLSQSSTVPSDSASQRLPASEDGDCPTMRRSRGRMHQGVHPMGLMTSWPATHPILHTLASPDEEAGRAESPTGAQW